MTRQQRTKPKSNSSRPRPAVVQPDNDDGLSDHLSLDDLLEQSIEAEPHEIEGLGTVLVRGLSRDEAHEMLKNKDTKKREITIVAWGMVEPPMTFQQVEKWYRGAPAGQIQGVVERINRLSGLDEEAEKEAVDRFRDESGE